MGIPQVTTDHFLFQSLLTTNFHRNNGFTKIKPRYKMFTNSTNTVLQVNTGMLALLDLVTRSFLRT